MATTKIKHVFGNVMRVAIPLTMRVRKLIDGQETETVEDFYPNPNHDVEIVLYKGGGLKTLYIASIDGNVATFEDGGELPVGTYQVEVRAFDAEENPVRYMVRSIIEVVDATIDAGIEAGIEFDAETQTLEGAVFFYAKGDKGDKGDQGERGERGEQGIQGETGAKGDTGAQGVGVVAVEQITTSHESSGINVIRVTLSNGATWDFEITNGEKVLPTYNNEILTF